MIVAYRRLGHGANFVGAWTGYAFFIAAVVYVGSGNCAQENPVGVLL